MEEINNGISEKIKWNAISAYLFIFIAWLFLLNKTNDNINNEFVRDHVKTATLIHLGFLITIIIFLSNNLFASTIIMWIWLNFIITTIICLALLVLIILWIYKAKNGLTFNIVKDISISKTKNILDIDWSWNVTEKEKLTVLLAFIPVIWFINFARYKNNETIKNATRLNIIVSLIIALLFIFSYWNLANILSLIYTVLIVFIWINLFARDELISIKLPTIFSPQNTYIWFLSLIAYIKNYFNDKEFIDFNSINNQNSERLLKREQEDEKNLSTKKNLKLPKALIYIPILNLVFLFFKGTKYSFHIINGLIITILLIITWILAKLWYFNPSMHILSLFPILFWIWYTKNRLAYRTPIIFDIYLLFKKIFWFFKSSTKSINEKRKEENEVSLKVKTSEVDENINKKI